MTRRALGLPLLATLAACRRELSGPAVVDRGQGRVQYLLDVEHLEDTPSREKTITHVLGFNPGTIAVDASVAAYFPDRDPVRFAWQVPAGQPREMTTDTPPLAGARRCALRFETNGPLTLQTTVGWTNTLGDYTPRAATAGGTPQQEAARASGAARVLSTHLSHTDSIILDDPKSLWIREDEQLLVLNPGPRPAALVLHLLSGRKNVRVPLEVAAERLGHWPVAPFVTRKNRLHGVSLRSSVPVAAQWIRTVYHISRPAPMAFWSLPLVPVE